MSVTDGNVVSNLDIVLETEAHGLVKFVSLCQYIRHIYAIVVKTQLHMDMRRVIIDDGTMTVEVIEDEFGCAQTLIEQAFAKYLDMSSYLAISTVASRHSYDYNKYIDKTPKELAEAAFDMMEKRKRGPVSELDFIDIVVDKTREGVIKFNNAEELAYLKVAYPTGMVDGDEVSGSFYRAGCEYPKVRADEIVSQFMSRDRKNDSAVVYKSQVASFGETSLLRVLMMKDINSLSLEEKKKYGIGFFSLNASGKTKLLSQVRKGVDVAGLINYIVEEILIETHPFCNNKRDWAMGVIMTRKNVLKLEGDKVMLDSLAN